MRLLWEAWKEAACPGPGSNELPDLATLLERCRRGDDLAWEALVRLYQSRVYSLAWHYLHNAEEARDAALGDLHPRLQQPERHAQRHIHRLDPEDGMASVPLRRLLYARARSTPPASGETTTAPV